jgi:hypothetical protein
MFLLSELSTILLYQRFEVGYPLISDSEMSVRIGQILLQALVLFHKLDDQPMLTT